MYLRISAIFTLATVLIFTLAAPVRSENFTFKPSLTLEERYDSNVRFRSKGEGVTSDFISTASPGLSLDYTRPLYTLKTDYSLFANYHTRKHDLNSVNHRASLDIDMDLTKRIKLSAGDRFYYTKDSLQALPTGIQLARTDILSNTVFAGAGYQATPKADVSLTLTDHVIHFKEPALIDSTTKAAALSGGYKYNPEGTARLTYTFTNFHFDPPDGRTIDSHALRLGISENVTSTLAVQLAGGAVYTPNLNGAKYFITGDASISETYKDSAISLAYSRRVTNPTGLSSELNINDTVSFTLDQTIDQNTKAKVFGGIAKNRSEPSGRVDVNSYYVGLAGSYKATEWMTLGIGANLFQQWTGDDLSIGLRRNQVFINVTFTGGEWRF